MLIEKENVEKVGGWQNYVNDKLNLMSLANPKDEIYRGVIISDDLFEELSGKLPVVKLGEDWEDTQRCPKCGDYMFIVNRKQNGIAQYDSNGVELWIENTVSQTNSIKCKCGTNICIDYRDSDLDY